MNPIEVVIIGTGGLAKDQHPMGDMPKEPKETEFKDREKYLAALEEYSDKKNKWDEIEKTLKTYQIHSLVCDSKMIVCNSVLHWHIGKKYKANILANNTLQVI